MATAPAAPAVIRSRAKADRILVFKRKRTMQLMLDQDVLFTFRVALGRQPRGPKERRGDFRTPEGTYQVAGFNPGSYFYRAIAVSYPNPEDIARARAMGVSPGGDIAIHGLDPAIAAKWREEHWMFNWTRGCIAVTNHEMDLIWDRVAMGTPIEIQP
ncbi:MAG: L,D-transpeptidase family protein [Geminicoccaceae bacterium]